MRGSASHLRPLSRVPGAAQTALELKLDNYLLYFQNAILLMNSFLVQGSAAMVNTAGSLAQNLPYKNSTGGSSQGGGTGTGGTGTGDTGGGIL